MTSAYVWFAGGRPRSPLLILSIVIFVSFISKNAFARERIFYRYEHTLLSAGGLPYLFFSTLFVPFSKILLPSIVPFRDGIENHVGSEIVRRKRVSGSRAGKYEDGSKAVVCAEPDIGFHTVAEHCRFGGGNAVT